MTVQKYIEKNRTDYTFHQKSFPLILTFSGVKIAEASSDWKYSPNSYKDAEYRTTFILFRTEDSFYLVKIGESSDSSDRPYEDIYKFEEFETLRDWLLDPSYTDLTVSRPIVRLLESVPKCGDALSKEEKTHWVACFLEGRANA
jgi:hypothetical protein